MKQWLHDLRIHFQDKRIRNAFLISLGLMFLLLLFFGQGAKNTEVPATSVVETDELIPDGFVLVPLDLENKEALHSLIGSFAMVDLFQSSLDGKEKGKRIISQVRLLRSPEQPDQFAALIAEEKASQILSHKGPLFAVIRNRKTTARITKPTRRNEESRIRIYTGETK